MCRQNLEAPAISMSDSEALETLIFSPATVKAAT